MGEFCSIPSGVVVAQAYEECPVIGDYVELLIDCKVLGGIRVADYAHVRAGALVLKNCDDSDVILGRVQARKIGDRGARETPVYPICE